MAQQTKSNAKRSSSGGQRGSSNGQGRSRARTAPKRNSGGSRAKSASAKSPVAAAKDATVKGATSAKDATVKGATSAKEATVEGASSAGNAIASNASRLKFPAIAAGVGLAGLASGIALASDRRHKKFGAHLPSRMRVHRGSINFKDAAKEVSTLAERTGQVAAQTGRIAERVQVASEAISQNGASRRSPIEVVLEGLTNRSSRRRPAA